MSDKKFLTETELLEIERASFKQKLLEKDLLISKRNKDYADLELTLLSANYTLKKAEALKLSQAFEESKKELENQRKKGADLISELGQTHDLGKKWGYDPLTGEIDE